MARTKGKQLYIRLKSLTTGEWLVHPELRQRMVADVAAQGTNLTDVATLILAGRYKIAYESTGRRTDPRLDEDFLNFNIPWKLWTAISHASLRSRRTELDEVRYTLCAHYGLVVPPKPLRTRTRI